MQTVWWAGGQQGSKAGSKAIKVSMSNLKISLFHSVNSPPTLAETDERMENGQTDRENRQTRAYTENNYKTATNKPTKPKRY